ncbi:MAG: MBOAT family protein, partial [Marinobacter sp.]|nr:MBOAT family protein [Marinobacter sp.]
MVFSSNIFLFLFLPLFLGIYYLAPFRYRSLVILIGSYAFYAWWRVDFLLLFVAVTVWNYLIGLGIHRAGIGTAGARKWVAVGVAGDLATLAYFKYANFGVESLNELLVAAGSEPLEMASIILPIGISFYVFQAISYVVDVYRGDTEPTRRFVDFAAFIALFPQLIAGPVLRYKDLADQFNERTHTLEKFGEGSVRFMQGFIKKVFIADSIAPLADNAFALADPTMADAWLGILAYTAQLYFDFSGYSDMAIGLGLMMGFRFPENFNQPYISQSITEFWRRWHISLSTWLRDYLYIPLGGNRNSTLKTYRNLMLTMLLGGLWHGANWTFLLWGAWHGLLLSLERWRGVSGSPVDFRWLRWATTFLFVMLGWVTFRASTLSDAFGFYGAMFSFDGAGLSSLYLQDIRDLNLAILALAYMLIALMGLRDRLDLIGRSPVGGMATAWRSA